MLDSNLIIQTCHYARFAAAEKLHMIAMTLWETDRSSAPGKEVLRIVERKETTRQDFASRKAPQINIGNVSFNRKKVSFMEMF